MSIRKTLWIIAIFLFIIISTAFSTAYATSYFNETEERFMLLPPSDTISEGQIKVYRDKIIIHINDAQWSSYLDTNSMSPVLFSGANGIEIIPKTKSEVHIGDIIAYETKWNNIPVIHRVVDIRQDELGTYFITKGDNNASADPVKVRFDQIRYKLIAIIY